MAGERWQARRLLTAPHRLGFFAAAAMLGLSALWWGGWMLSSHALGIAWPWTLSPALAHGLWFGFGFMPLFFAGFVFTAGPKWLGLPPVEARSLLRSVAGLVAGWLVFVAGVHTRAGLAALGLALAAAAWSALLRRLAGLLRAAPDGERLHLRIILAAGGAGSLALLGAAAGLVGGREDLVRAALHAGLWCFVVPVFVAAAHRLVPFLGDPAAPWLAARWPDGLLWILLALCIVQWPLWLTGAHGGQAAGAWAVVQGTVDAVAALLVATLCWRWARVQGLRTRMITMLYLGFVWLGVAFALAAVSSWLGDARPWRMAALHALTMGFLGSTLLAMATRVASGQAGRSVAADAPAWAMFLALQLAVLLRIGAALWPAAEALLRTAAALAWLAAMGGWALRYGAWFGRPRFERRSIRRSLISDKY